MSHQNYLYISIGEFSIYYTLRNVRTEVQWTDRDEFGNYNNHYGENDYYLFNLSTDKKEAIQKAEKYAKENNLKLLRAGDDLVVTGKIGDAKEDRQNKYGLSTGEFTEKKRPDEPMVWKIPTRSPADIEADKLQKEQEEKIKQERLDFYKHPEWKQIRRYLWLNAIHSEYGSKLHALKTGSLRWRQEARHMWDSCGDFVRNMVRDIDNKWIMSPRALVIVLEIYCKQFGRKGSKAFKKEFDKLIGKFDG